MSPSRPGAASVSLSLLLACLAVPAPGSAAEPSPPKVDISKLHDQLVVLHDKKGHYLVVPNLLEDAVRRSKARSPLRRAIFYGDSKILYRVRVAQQGRSGGSFSLVCVDPRAREPLHSSFLYRQEHAGGPVFRCDKRALRLWPLEGAARARLLTKATFRDIYWRRHPHLLARDDDGRYFYVDRQRTSLKESIPALDFKGFRLWIGRRGKMKRVPLRDAIIDPAGQIFITKTGKLRVDSKKKQISWRRADKVSVLTRVLVSAYNGGLTMVYRQLGPYLGARLRLPCDDW